MTEESAFIEAIHANPRDNETRLVYADWLEEQGGPGTEAKSEFLRLTVRLGIPTGKKKKAGRTRLQELAAGLDTDWLAVVSRLPIENCHAKRAKAESGSMSLVRFDYVCDRRWEDLNPTEDQAVRFCEGCRHEVHYCDTIVEARKHAENRHCIAVDLGVIRRERDLEPERLVMGRVGADWFRREEERLKPDPVSAERELRKQQARQGKQGETPAESGA